MLLNKLFWQKIGYTFRKKLTGSLTYTIHTNQFQIGQGLKYKRQNY